MFIKKYSFDKVKVLLVTAVIILLGLVTKQCNNRIPVTTDLVKNSLKSLIHKQMHVADSLKKLAVKDDSVRTEYITKWRTKIKTIILHDSIPCDSALPIVISTCDSVIVKDSLYIRDLKHIIQVDSIIINSQAKVMRMDSVKIERLSKDVGRLKKHRRWLLVSTGVLAGVLILITK